MPDPLTSPLDRYLNERLPAWDTASLFPEGMGATDAPALRVAADRFMEQQETALRTLAVQMKDTATANDATGLLAALDESAFTGQQIQRARIYFRLLHVQNPQDAALTELYEHVANRSNALDHLSETDHTPILALPLEQRRALLKAVPNLKDYDELIVPEDAKGRRNTLPYQEVARRMQGVNDAKAGIIAEYDAAHMSGPVGQSNPGGLQACAHAYNQAIAVAYAEAEAQGYPDPLALAAAQQHLQPETIQRWWASAPAAIAQAVQRMDALHYHDRPKATLLQLNFAQRPPHVYEWNEAREIVTEALSEFNPGFRPILDRAFTEGWIQARPVGPNRAGGATYNNVAAAMLPTGDKAAHPFVHSEFHGTEFDMVRLAHELGGHCLATQMANERGRLSHITDSTLHETFALFAQKLVVNKMLDRAKSPEHRFAILSHTARDSFLNLYESTARCLFQRATFSAAKQPDGSLRPLSVDELSNLHRTFGRSTDFGKQRENRAADTDWANSMHLYMQQPFYNDSYRQAIMASNALYDRWQAAQGPARAGFARDWADVMGAGGGIRFPEAMQKMGVQVNGPYFLSQGLAGVNRSMERAEAAMDEISSVRLFFRLPVDKMWDLAKISVKHVLGIKSAMLIPTTTPPQAVTVSTGVAPQPVPMPGLVPDAVEPQPGWQIRMAPATALAEGGTSWQDRQRLRQNALGAQEGMHCTPQWI